MASYLESDVDILTRAGAVWNLRASHESERAWQAWLLYRAIPAPRPSLRQWAIDLGYNQRSVRTWSSKFGWMRKLGQLDATLANRHKLEDIIKRAPQNAFLLQHQLFDLASHKVSNLTRTLKETGEIGVDLTFRDLTNIADKIRDSTWAMLTGTEEGLDEVRRSVFAEIFVAL